VDPLAEACEALGIASEDVIASHVYPDRVVLVVRQGPKLTYYTATQPAIVTPEPIDPQSEIAPLPFDEPPDPSAVPDIAPEDAEQPQPDAPQSILPKEVVKSRRKKAK